MNDETPGAPEHTPWPLEPLPPVEPDLSLPRKRGWALIAWIVILLLTCFATLGQMLIKETPGASAQEHELELVLLQAQARSLVGAARFIPGEAISMPYDQAQKTLNKGSVAARLRFITVAGELAGPQEALKQLDLLDRKFAENSLRLPQGRTHLIAQAIAALGVVSPGAATPVVPQPAGSLGVAGFDASDLLLPAPQAELKYLLRRLYQDYAHLRMNTPSLSAADRQKLRARLSWFGDLALAPPDFRAVRESTLAAASVVAAAAAPTVTPETIAGSMAVVPLRDVKPAESAARTTALDEARETFLTFAGAVMVIVLVGLSGCVGLIAFLVLLCRGKLQGGLVCGSLHGGIAAKLEIRNPKLETNPKSQGPNSKPASLLFRFSVFAFRACFGFRDSDFEFRCKGLHGGIYAETFALWMVLYIGLLLAAQFLPPEVRLPGQGLLALLSLVVLGWPVLRGIPWQQVRQEIGLTTGRQPALEPLVGVGCYAMAFPFVALGVVVVVLITLAQQAAEGGPGSDNFEPGIRAAHPIVVVVAHGSWWTRLQVLFLASIVAPVVEETMFRGVLYRHLREATCKARAVWSILASAVVVSFLFAVIHPQGLLGVPLLMGLAFGFILAREWRDCLVPGIVAHALNNTLVMLFAILAFGS